MFDKNPYSFLHHMLPAHVRNEADLSHNAGQYNRIRNFMRARVITPSRRQHLEAVLRAIKLTDDNAYADGLVYPVQAAFVSWELKHYGGPKLRQYTKPRQPAWKQKIEKYL